MATTKAIMIGAPIAAFGIWYFYYRKKPAPNPGDPTYLRTLQPVAGGGGTHHNPPGGTSKYKKVGAPNWSGVWANFQAQCGMYTQAQYGMWNKLDMTYLAAHNPGAATIVRRALHDGDDVYIAGKTVAPHTTRYQAWANDTVYGFTITGKKYVLHKPGCSMTLVRGSSGDGSPTVSLPYLPPAPLHT